MNRSTGSSECGKEMASISNGLSFRYESGALEGGEDKTAARGGTGVWTLWRVGDSRVSSVSSSSSRDEVFFRDGSSAWKMFGRGREADAPVVLEERFIVLAF